MAEYNHYQGVKGYYSSIGLRWSFGCCVDVGDSCLQVVRAFIFVVAWVCIGVGAGTFLPTVIFLLTDLTDYGSSIPGSLMASSNDIEVVRGPSNPLCVYSLGTTNSAVSVPLDRLIRSYQVIHFRASSRTLFGT